MAEAITVARPYAQAAFMYAAEQHALPEWSGMLTLLAGIASDATMVRVIESPQLTETQLADL
ncbi:MAG TPA: F0F1 ATP synthase subunit delta, partial [Gammaproteobacteria bacterium]|nr:F0F1 ATP synthase subunit delta [Gammaproteobacteria bacterium]